MTQRYRTNGKLLITGEYVVLNGAKALAVPTRYGQSLRVEEDKTSQLQWNAYLKNGQLWFSTSLEISNPAKITVRSKSKSSKEEIKKTHTLIKILEEAQRLNPDFLIHNKGYKVETHLEFPTNWGLGSSSTLIANIANWAEVNPYNLLWNSFKGSGYDIACANCNQSLIYKLKDNNPEVQLVDFQPPFSEQLFFIHLNRKQNSREGIQRYKTLNTEKDKKNNLIHSISELTLEFTNAKSLDSFEKLMIEHERIISSMIQLEPIKQQYFNDFKGAVKSLGAWGGDFIMATGEEDYIEHYFKNKGFTTVLAYDKMVHNQ